MNDQASYIAMTSPSAAANERQRVQSDVAMRGPPQQQHGGGNIQFPSNTFSQGHGDAFSSNSLQNDVFSESFLG